MPCRQPFRPNPSRWTGRLEALTSLRWIKNRWTKWADALAKKILGFWAIVSSILKDTKTDKVFRIQALYQLLTLMDRLKIFCGRVSTDQVGQDTSAKRQLEIGQDGDYDLVLIDRESGRNIGRPEYTKLINLIRAGRVESVTATRSDRIGRNAAEMTYFYDLCTKNKTQWIYLDEPQLNSESPWGYAQRKDAAHAAEMESIKLGLRQESAYRHAEEKGRVISRTVPLGLRVNAEKKFECDWLLGDRSNIVAKDAEIELATAEIARKLIELFLEQETVFHGHKKWIEWVRQLEAIDVEKIARIAKFRYGSTIDWLQHPELRGHMGYGKYEKYYVENQSSRTITSKYRLADRSQWRIVYNTHTGLIDAAEAKEIDRIIAMNQSYGFALASAKREPGTPVSLSPILRCECGKAVNLSSCSPKDKRYRYYYCSVRYECKSRRAPEELVVHQIIDQIGLQAEQLLGAVKSAIGSEQEQDSSEVRKLKAERDKVTESFKSTGMSVFLEAEKQLSEKIAALQRSPSAPILNESSQQFLQAIKDPDFWLSMPQCDRHDWFRKVVRVARLQNGQVVSVELSV